MKKIISLYKFKTPFLDIKKENANLENLRNKISVFFRAFGLNMNEKIIENELYKNIIFSSSEGIVLNLGLNKDYKNNFMPVLFIDLNMKKTLIQEIDLNDFLQLFFEIFPAINENDIIIENNLDFPINSHFLDIEMLNKKFKDISQISNIIENFIQNKELNNFYEIKEVFLFFNALMFENFKNIRKTQNTLNENKEILKNYNNNNILEANLDLSNKRLNNLLFTNIDVFKKYTIMLENFYKLFN